jgi:NhaP-type Na+/H+ or K+/H+ antiporter
MAPSARGEYIVVVDAIGAVCFGLVIGWVTYRTLRRTGETVAVSNLASVIGAVGGAAVTGLFSGHLFGWYCIGLAAGFFGYLILAVTRLKDVPWLGDGS